MQDAQDVKSRNEELRSGAAEPISDRQLHRPTHWFQFPQLPVRISAAAQDSPVQQTGAIRAVDLTNEVRARITQELEEMP